MQIIKGIQNEKEQGLHISYDDTHKGIIKMESTSTTDFLIQAQHNRVDVHTNELRLHVHRIKIDELASDSSYCPQFVTIDERGYIRAQTSLYAITAGFFLFVQTILLLYKYT